MANDEHLAIFWHGVETWNLWRLRELDIIPDLNHSNFQNYELSKINFSGVNLIKADFKNANLTLANLSKANLCLANFSAANLSNADFSGSDLTLATFNLADSRYSITQIPGFEAQLIEANFNEARLVAANLCKANLARANLTKANVSEARLVAANLVEANLVEANLCYADLTESNFTKADLRGVALIGTQVIGTNFTEACLTGACIQDWNISSTTKLDNVICEYIYLREGKQERRPLNGNFQQGEFTKLFQKSLETVDLIFLSGIDWDAFAYSFKKVEVENQDARLDVQSIEKKGDGILVVRVSVSPNADKAKIHSEFMQGYEFAHKALEAQYQARLEDKDKEINRLFYLLDKANEQLGEVPKLLAENPRKVSNYYQQNSQFAGGVVDAETVQSQQIGGNIQNIDNQNQE